MFLSLLLLETVGKVGSFIFLPLYDALRPGDGEVKGPPFPRFLFTEGPPYIVSHLKRDVRSLPAG